MHGLMVYDMLYSWDQDLKPRRKWSKARPISRQADLYFVLRPASSFTMLGSDDARRHPVTQALDGARRSWARSWPQFASEMRAVDDKTFVLQSRSPSPSSRSRLAQRPARCRSSCAKRRRNDRSLHQHPEAMRLGTVPLRAVRMGAGAKVVYEKNPDYIPRAEPAAVLPAQGRQGRSRRIQRLPDPTTKATALQSGEIDIIDQTPHDQAGLLEKVPASVVDICPRSPITGLLGRTASIALQQREGAPGAGHDGQQEDYMAALRRQEMVARLLLVLRLRSPTAPKPGLTPIGSAEHRPCQGATRRERLQGREDHHAQHA